MCGGTTYSGRRGAAEAVEFLSVRDEETTVEFVTEALRIGLTALRLTQTTADVELVERKLSEMLAEFSAGVDSATDEVGEPARVEHGGVFVATFVVEPEQPTVLFELLGGPLAAHTQWLLTPPS